MVDVQLASRPRNIPPPTVLIPRTSPVAMPSTTNGRMLDALSPVNQNGSFEFDRVIKSGPVRKRTRKTKTWKPIFLVLRPDTLSIYRDENESKLRHKIVLADLTAVALLKDPKHKKENLFGLFSPSRNYHLEARSRQDAEEWAELIRRQARIEEEEEEYFLASPRSYGAPVFDREMQRQREQRILREDRMCSSSPEPIDHVRYSTRQNSGGVRSQRTNTFDYSGNEMASHSDMSDLDPDRCRGASSTSVPDDLSVKPPRPILNLRNTSQTSGFPPERDPERVIWQGYLLYLKSKGGVRQWKDLWTVLRPRSFAIYKDDSEYAPLLILPMMNIINAVEIDPLSKTKKNCLQVITEEKTYKFCAHSEEMLDKCLGAFKSLVVKRKENR